MAEPRPRDRISDTTKIPTLHAWTSRPTDDTGSKSSRLTASTASSSAGCARIPYSARERDPRACPLAGASRDYESVHRQFHDNAAGARDTWWLRQRDISTNYARSNGTLVGGPPVLSLPNENLNARSRHIAKQLREAFAGAAGHRTCVVGDLAPKPVLGSQRMDGPDVAQTPPHSERRKKHSRRDTVRSKQQNAGSLQARTRKPREDPAGKRSMGIAPRQQGLKVYPEAADVCETDGLIPGREILPRRAENHFGVALRGSVLRFVSWGLALSADLALCCCSPSQIWPSILALLARGDWAGCPAKRACAPERLATLHKWTRPVLL